MLDFFSQYFFSFSGFATSEFFLTVFLFIGIGALINAILGVLKV